MIYEPSNVPTLLNRFNLIVTHNNHLAAADEKFKIVPYSSNMVDLCPYNKPTCLPAATTKSKLCSAIISIGGGTSISSALSLRREVVPYLDAHQSVDLFGDLQIRLRTKLML